MSKRPSPSRFEDWPETDLEEQSLPEQAVTLLGYTSQVNRSGASKSSMTIAW